MGLGDGGELGEVTMLSPHTGPQHVAKEPGKLVRPLTVSDSLLGARLELPPVVIQASCP